MSFSDYLPTLLPAIILVFIAGALMPLAFRNPRREAIASFVPAVIASLLTVALSASVLLSGSVFQLSSPIVEALPSMSLSFYVDGISIFFMLIIGLVSTSVCIYSLGYSRSYS